MSDIQINIVTKAQELAKEKNDWDNALSYFDSLQVTSTETLEATNGYLREIVQRKDELTKQLKAGTDPLNKALKEIRSWFAPTLTACEHVEAKLKGKISAYVVEQQRIRDEQFRLAATAHDAGDHAGTALALNAATEVPTEAPQGTSIREVWEAEIFAPDLVPLEWRIPDEKRIAANARSTKIDQTPMPIAGVRYSKKAIVAVRR